MNMLYLHMPFSIYIVTSVLVLMSPHILFRVDRWKDGQTDMTKLTVTICNFANTPIKPSTLSLLAIEQS